MMRRAAALGLVGAALLGFGSHLRAAEPQASPLPDDVTAELDALRTAWPDIAEPKTTDGYTWLFDQGVILLGNDRLRKIREAPENSTGVVLTFLLAHEAWHSVRSRHAGHEAEMTRQMVECEADFMGANWTYRRLAEKGLKEAELRAARRDLQAFTEPDFRVPNADYPSADTRRMTIDLGWAVAQFPALLASPAPVEMTAFEMCRKLTNQGNASPETVSLNWTTQDVDDAVTGPGRNITLTAINKTAHTVKVSYMGIYRQSWPSGRAPGRFPLNEISQLIEEEVTLSGKYATVTRVYPVERTPARGAAGRALAPWPPEVATYTYSDPAVDHGVYCSEKLASSQLSERPLDMLSVVALSAEGDFAPIRTGDPSNTPNGPKYRIIRGLSDGASRDRVVLGSGMATATITTFDSDDAGAAEAEFSRLQAVLRDVCGADTVRSDPQAPLELPMERNVTIANFLPGIDVSLWLYLKPAGSASAGSPAGGTGAGSVAFRIVAQPIPAS